ncbi:hypothetical protein MML48_5g00015610 [Holotrichia oblita]|uniref:Uncharacterized protein n=1 Tax=Holotrichia oblita TaxID=644536 RepID=A0ACB9T2F7_HOLOL|nr:hypothetical protein MML48_5g00015610 [Holotrichia oblita]
MRSLYSPKVTEYTRQDREISGIATDIDRQTGLIMYRKNVGRPTALSLVEEELIVDHILAVGDQRLALSTYDVRCIIKSYLDNNKRKVSQFNDKRPGWEWKKLFVERHRVLKEIFAANIPRRRAQVDEIAVTEFFTHLENELEGVPPFDESGFHDVPKKTKSLFRRTCRHPEVVRNSIKSCFTMVFCGSAAGEVLPPYIIFHGKNRWSDWLYNGPEGSRMNDSDQPEYILCQKKGISKLPSYTKPNNLQETVGEEFKLFLEGVRSFDLTVAKKVRKFQLPELPGKSASAEEVQTYYKNKENALKQKEGKQTGKRGRLSPKEKQIAENQEPKENRRNCHPQMIRTQMCG